MTPINYFQLYKKKSKEVFSILSTNIQDSNAKIDELKIFVEHLKPIDFEFSAISIYMYPGRLII